MTPLHYAVTLENKYVIELLLRNNVDLEIADKDGETPLDIATTSIKKFIESFSQ